MMGTCIYRLGGGNVTFLSATADTGEDLLTDYIAGNIDEALRGGSPLRSLLISSLLSGGINISKGKITGGGKKQTVPVTDATDIRNAVGDIDASDVRKVVNDVEIPDVKNAVKDIDATDISGGKYSLYGEIAEGDGKAYEKFLKDGPQEGLTQAEIIGIYKADRQAALNAISQNAVSGKGVEGGGYSDAVFASEDKLVSHFDKHGDEFKGLYNSVDEYLQGARDVMNNGYKVEYSYKGETRMGFVQFMGNNSKGKAKFAFVGTNNEGYITTFHTESGKTFWKLLNNGENIPVINPK